MFAKTAATERTYRLPMNENLGGRHISPVITEPTVASLRRLELLNAETVIATIEKGPQSHEPLTVDSKGAGGPDAVLPTSTERKTPLFIKRSLPYITKISCVWSRRWPSCELSYTDVGERSGPT